MGPFNVHQVHRRVRVDLAYNSLLLFLRKCFMCILCLFLLAIRITEEIKNQGLSKEIASVAKMIQPTLVGPVYLNAHKPGLHYFISKFAVII